MTTPRRRLLRTLSPPAPVPDPRRARQLQRLRTRLEQERQCLQRWLRRLKLAFHAVEKSQARVRRLEQQLNQTEE
jgi:hypothetical protein